MNKTLRFSHKAIAFRAADFPGDREQAYLRDLRTLVVSEDADGAEIDVQSEAYWRLVDRYLMPKELWGPRRWRRLHAARDPGAEWLGLYIETLPCEDCRNHFRQLVAAHPAPIGQGDAAWFGWTVDRHNDVNERLGKPRFELLAA